MNRMLKALTLAALCAAPLQAQVVDTIRSYPGDTVRVVAPRDTGRYWIDVTRRTGGLTYLQHSLWIVSPRPAAPPVVTPPPTQPPVTPPPTASAPTPDLANAESFEAGWFKFMTGNFAQPPMGVTRDTTRAHSGRYAVRKELRITPAGQDDGAQFMAQLYDNSSASYNLWGYHVAPRMWTKVWFYTNTAFDCSMCILKFQLYGDGQNQHGGLYFNNGYLGWVFTEALYNNGTTYNLVPLASLANGWHSVEVDYWRNGDTSCGSDTPSAAIWLDGVQLTTGQGQPTGGTRWVNNRLNACRRQFTAPIGQVWWLGIKNGGNTVGGTVWVDDISISTKGRIP